MYLDRYGCAVGEEFMESAFRYKKWRAQRDSNPRHPVPKTGALSAELWAHDAYEL